MKEMQGSSGFSSMIDGNIDKTWKEHLIIYDTILGNSQDIGHLETSFLKFLNFFNDTSQVIFHVISNFLRSWGSDIQKMVAITMDGVSSMIGSRSGLVTSLKVESLLIFS